MADITGLERSLGYSFKDADLLRLALVHPSYAGEHKGTPHNQRLEYLGDAVFELAVSTMLYTAFSALQEGELSKLRARIVSEQGLFAYAKRIGLGNYIVMSTGEAADGGNSKPSIVSDAMEAVIGAVYLDGGYESAFSVIKSLIGELPAPQGATDYKSRLQEKLQQNGAVSIAYIQTEESGAPHDRTYRFEVSVNGKVMGQGCGKNKKNAQQAAAQQALSKLK